MSVVCKCLAGTSYFDEHLEHLARYTVGISKFVLFGVQNWYEGVWSETEALMVTWASEKFTDYILG